jgi:quinol monooxygenase YgiN
LSVIVTMRMPGDTDRFRTFLTTQEDRMRDASDKARAAGCLHHQFGIGDGYMVVVDEWESAEAFERFFSDPELQQLVSEAGAQGEPELSFAEAVDTVDKF